LIVAALAALRGGVSGGRPSFCTQQLTSASVQ